MLIRNFKQKVTDMAGGRLFQPVRNHPETSTTEAERDFYDLTHFILSGNAYASGLRQSQRRQVTLVLIAMQKIASSSVAAIRAALKRRLQKLKQEVAELRDRSRTDFSLGDEEDANVEQAFTHWLNQARFRLLEDEVPHLESLLDAADKIDVESKIARIGPIIDERYSDCSVLLFTEYKATQALMVSTLMARFGTDSVGFINGDNRLEEIRLPLGKETAVTASREATADAFNQGRIRFLVSTEAGGEGIDLQGRCHTLIHVDLPWNPMRLHQRVGRLSRYGQKHSIDVVTIRNPSTVESRIWSKLETKLSHIMEALGHAMDEPEDLMQMVLGMTGPGFFNELLSEGQSVPPERLEEWFDAKTRSLGGKSAIETVTDLVGHCQSFDLSQLDDVPRKDLPDLVPFFYGALLKNRRRPDREGGSFSFKTPNTWLGAPGVRPRYDDLIFHRHPRDAEESKRIVGVGHQVLDQALFRALEEEGVLAQFRESVYPLAVFQVQDAVTSGAGHLRRVVVGVTEDNDGALNLLRDEHVLDLLNRHKPGRADRERASRPISSDLMLAWLERAREHAIRNVAGLQLPFRKPLLNDLALFWPESGDSDRDRPAVHFVEAAPGPHRQDLPP